MCGQLRNILGPVTQRGNFNGEGAKTIVQIFAELSLADQGQQVRVGGGDDAGIHPHHVGAAQALQFFLLQKTQQLGLQAQRHLADLVQEERASLCHLDSSRIRLHGSGESAARVSEEFGFEQGLGNGGAIDHREGAPGARTQLMNGAGHDFLAAAGRARDQHGCIPLRQQARQTIYGLHDA